MPEHSSLLHAKLTNPLKQGEQLAEKLRKSKRKQLQSKTRGVLYGNVTPRERSVSPMFTGLQVEKLPKKMVPSVTRLGGRRSRTSSRQIQPKSTVI